MPKWERTVDLKFSCWFLIHSIHACYVVIRWISCCLLMPDDGSTWCNAWFVFLETFIFSGKSLTKIMRIFIMFMILENFLRIFIQPSCCFLRFFLRILDITCGFRLPLGFACACHAPFLIGWANPLNETHRLVLGAWFQIFKWIIALPFAPLISFVFLIFISFSSYIFQKS